MDETRKVALVTGGARRVGRAIVERFARDGWDVAFTFKSSQREALQLQADLAPTGVRVLPLNADFDRLEQSIEMLRQRLLRWSPRLDALVNNASAFAPDARLSAEAAMRTNYVAPLRLVEAFRAELTAAGGSVVNLLDVMAERPVPAFANYAASKAALWTATRSLARSLAPAVRVNGIAPGVVAWNDAVGEAERAAYERKVPLGRVGTPAELATLVAFLVNDATFVTGEVIRIDGGRSLAS